MIKSFEDFQAIGKDRVDAYVASATALSKGFQTITAEAVDFSRKMLNAPNRVNSAGIGFSRTHLPFA